MTRTCIALVCLVLSGCGGDDGDDGGDTGTNSASASATVSATGDTANASASASATASATATLDPTGDSSGDPTDTAADSSGDATATAGASTGGPEACEAASDDTACDTCVKESCCAQLTACDADPDCVCFQECAAGMPPSLQVPMVCGEQCEIETPFAHPTVGQLLSCSAGCSADCGV